MAGGFDKTNRTSFWWYLSCTHKLHWILVVYLNLASLPMLIRLSLQVKTCAFLHIPRYSTCLFCWAFCCVAQIQWAFQCTRHWSTSSFQVRSPRSWFQCYKMFFLRHWYWGRYVRNCIPGRHCQLGQMFAGLWALILKSLRCSIWKDWQFSENIRLGWKTCLGKPYLSEAAVKWNILW